MYSKLSGAEVLARLRAREAQAMAKGKPSTYGAEKLTFGREEWRLVRPWQLALQDAMNAGHSGWRLLEVALARPCDGIRWNISQRSARASFSKGAAE